MRGDGHEVRSSTRRLARLTLAVLLMTLLACDPSPPPPQPGPEAGPDGQPVAADGGLGLRVLSNRPDLLSGGDAFVEVLLPAPGARPPGFAADVDGTDVTDAFAIRPDGRMLGLVDGLRRGENTLRVRAANLPGARLVLTNHAIGGPIFAGEQVQPWRCATERHGLGPPRDEQCNTARVHQLLYRSTSAEDFLPYDPDDPPPPSDIATTTTDTRQTVPYIVRRERGVIDRGIYDIAVLFEPGAPWEPWAPQPSWNRKVLWTFGGSCQPYHGQQPPEGRPDRPPSPGVLIDRALSRGYAVASSAMNVLGSNCNTIVSAEALMMVKERLIETYGEVRFTIGLGGSGGSISALHVADAYPGLLNGLIIRSTFADLASTTVEMFDCRLLLRYFAAAPAGRWDDETIAAVQGHDSPATCNSWVRTFGFAAMVGDPTVGCTAPLRSFTEREDGALTGAPREPGWVYDPQTNAGGVRCTLFDYLAAVYGRHGDGRARRPYDNVGVQYGRTALLDGRISAEQFVDLNRRIGGLDLDYGFTASRTAAPRAAIRAAYRSGQLPAGAGLAGAPIIDASFAPPGARIHTAYHSWKLRERLLAANGTADNHAIVQGAGEGRMFRLMDRWLRHVERDDAEGTRAERVARNRPDEAADEGDYAATNPRVVAGAPLTDDVLKCALRPLDRTDYPGVAFSDAQWRDLQAAFPDGVCDWSQPGVGTADPVPWATYAGDGAAPLPAPPTFEPLR